MKIDRATLSTCSRAAGLVVAIDVIRAFTTAGFLFEAGVEEIYLVSSVEEAFALRAEMPGCLISGEVGGEKVPGFDLGNAPSRVAGRDFRGKRVIQRTSAGTQGVVLASGASAVFTAALTNITATARAIQRSAAEQVTLVQTGNFPDSGRGDEDVACADALEALLIGQAVDWTAVARRVRASLNAAKFDGSSEEFPPQDLDLVLEIDRFDFAMAVTRENGLHVMRKAEGISK